jgi:hypothetical protein
MLNYNKRLSISSEMLKYIRESTNKSLEKYLTKYNINALELKDRTPNCIILLPFVSLISFLAGYNFNNFVEKLTN